MKKLARLSAVLFLMKSPLSAQMFTGMGGLNVPPGAPAQTTGLTVSDCSVSGVGILDGCRRIDKVSINIPHTAAGDLGIFLVAPSGQVLELSTDNGGVNDNYSNTMFTDNAPTFITSGVPPFLGSFRPEGRQQSLTPPYPNAAPPGTFTFLNTFNGVDADGTWQLYINDSQPFNSGFLVSWSITFTYVPPATVTFDGLPNEFCIGSTGPFSLRLNFSPAPPAGLTYNVTIARSPGSNLTFNNIAPTGNNWTTMLPFPPATTTYTLSSITANGGGCTPLIGDPESVTITMNPQPVAMISGDTTLCMTDNCNELDASGGTSFLWLPSNSTLDHALFCITPASQPGQTFPVALVATDDNGCKDTAYTHVRVFAAPAVGLAVAPNADVCEGGCKNITALLTGLGPFSFSWEFHVNGAFLAPGGDVASPTSPAVFQACVPPGAPPTVQVVVCELFDANCPD